MTPREDEADPRRSALAKAIIVVTIAVILAGFACIVALLAHAPVGPA